MHKNKQTWKHTETLYILTFNLQPNSRSRIWLSCLFFDYFKKWLSELLLLFSSTTKLILCTVCVQSVASSSATHKWDWALWSFWIEICEMGKEAVCPAPFLQTAKHPCCCSHIWKTIGQSYCFNRHVHTVAFATDILYKTSLSLSMLISFLQPKHQLMHWLHLEQYRTCLTFNRKWGWCISKHTTRG